MFEKATHSLGTYGKIAYGILLSMAALIPLAVGSLYIPLPETENQFTLFKLGAFLSLATFAFLFWALDCALGKREVRLHPTLYFALALVAVALLSFAFSDDKRTALFGTMSWFDGLIPLLCMALTIFVALQVIRNNSAMRLFLHVFVITSVLLALYGLLQFFGAEIAKFPSAIPFGRRSFSLYGNPNNYAAYLSFAVLFAAGLFMTEPLKGRRTLYGVALALNLAVSVTTMSRSVWVALVPALVVLVLIARRHKTPLEKEHKVLLGGGAALVVVLIVVSLTSSSADLNIATRITSIFNGSGSTGTRLEIWKSALGAISAHPLLGSGPDTFGISGMAHLTQAYLDQIGLSDIFNNAHSYPLQLAATIGVLGALAYYALALFALIGGLKESWRAQDKSNPSLVLYGAVACALLAYLIDTALSVTDIGVVAFFAITIAYLAAPKAQTYTFSSPAPGLALAALAFAAALYCTVMPVRFIVADHEKSVGNAQVASTDAQIQRYKKAMQLNPYEPSYVVSYLNAVGDRYLIGIASLQDQDLSAINTVIEEAYALFPHDFTLQWRVSYYRTAFASAFRTEELLNRATITIQEILDQVPLHLTVLGDEAVLYRVLGQEEEAQKLMAYIKSTGPDTQYKQESIRVFNATQR